jgi:hypothetical protein
VVSEEPNYRWLRRIGRYWILPSEMIPLVNVVLCAIVAGLAPRVGVPPSIIKYICSALLVSGIIWMFAQQHLFYSAIRCPACGHNPNRTKEGRRMRYGMNAMWTRLRSLSHCPSCGA